MSKVKVLNLENLTIETVSTNKCWEIDIVLPQGYMDLPLNEYIKQLDETLEHNLYRSTLLPTYIYFTTTEKLDADERVDLFNLAMSRIWKLIICKEKEKEDKVLGLGIFDDLKKVRLPIGQLMQIANSICGLYAIGAELNVKGSWFKWRMIK